MAKAKFERRKPHVNIGTIGHVDHGKTTLTSALTKVMGERGMAKFISYDEVAKASESQGRRDATKILTIAIAHVAKKSLNSFGGWALADASEVNSVLPSNAATRGPP